MAQLIDHNVQTGIVIAGAGIGHRALVADRQFLGDFTSTDGWAALSGDTTGIATDLAHILGTASLEFDKVDTAANSTFAGVEQTITAVDGGRFTPSDKLQTATFVSDLTNIASAFIRLGTDDSNYNQWLIADTAMTINVWDVHSVALSATELTVVGNGWDPSAITYVSVGINFDAEANTLADIRFDHLVIETAQMTTT